MTWLELYNFLHKKANDIHNLVTGEEYTCDTFYVDDDTGEKLVLMINIDQI